MRRLLEGLMGAETGIEWTDATWNPVGGCDILTPGCTNCYAMKIAASGRLREHPVYKGTTRSVNGNQVWNGVLTRLPDDHKGWAWPCSWHGARQPRLGPGRPSLIFVGDMADLFHAQRPRADIDRTIAGIVYSRHIGQLLTKRADVMRGYFQELREDGRWYNWRHPILGTRNFDPAVATFENAIVPRLWLGGSVEDNRRAEERVPHILQLGRMGFTTFLSCEPLLSHVHLGYIGWPRGKTRHRDGYNALIGARYDAGSIVELFPKIGWVICGGESGSSARPMHPDWARSLRDQCAAADVPFFFKQWGEWGCDGGPEESGRDRIMDGQARCAWFDGHQWHFENSGYAVDLRKSRGCGEWVYRVGKKAAGRRLDGVEHNAFPSNTMQEERQAA